MKKKINMNYMHFWHKYLKKQQEVGVIRKISYLMDCVLYQKKVVMIVRMLGINVIIAIEITLLINNLKILL